MNKKPFLSKHPKKILVFLLVCLITITLAGCDRADKKPTGGLDLDATYATATHDGKEFSVSNGDLYDKLRYNAVEYIEKAVNDFVYKSEIETVKADLEKTDSKYKEKMEETILSAIYGTSDEEEIEELNEKDVVKSISTYIDTMYQQGYTITKEQIEAKDFKSVYAYYYLEIAEYVAAYNKLAENFKLDENGKVKVVPSDITEDSYFNIDEVVSYYENNYTNTGDVTALLIRFINNDEVTNILKKFGLKHSGGKFYQIKYPEGADLVNPETASAWADQVAYDKYYKGYQLNLTGESGIEPIDQIGNGNATVLRVMIEIYNYIYTYRAETDETHPEYANEAINVDNNNVANYTEKYGHLNYYFYIKSIIDADKNLKDNDVEAAETQYDDLKELVVESDADAFVMDKERLDKYSTSVSNYLYNNLENDEYIVSSVSLGSYNYLFFKFDQVEDKKLYDEIENEDKETEYDFTNADVEFLNEVINEMFEEELSSTYIHNIHDERIEEVSLRIYDTLVETKFMNSTSELAESYEKNKKKNNDLLAKVTYKDNDLDIKVVDAFNYLEPLYGPQIASNLLFQQYIKGTKYYTELEDNFDLYVESIKYMLSYFSNDYYASNGYPSTIGKYNFMMLYFGTADVEEAAREYLMVSDATSAYYADFAGHGFEGDEFYSKLLSWHEQINTTGFYSITMSGLSVYVDRDEDGEADEMDEALLAEANALLEFAYQEAIHEHADYQTALNNIVNEFKKSSRIYNNNPTTAEYKWSYYRSLGLSLEVTSFGTFTNTSDSIYDTFKDPEGKEGYIENKIKDAYVELVDNKFGFTAAKFDNETITTDDNKLTKLLYTAGALPTSAKFETEDEDTKKLYENIKVVINDKQEIITVNYEKDEINIEQIKVYVAEYVLLGDVYSLPTETITALDAYILPLISKYTGSAGQMTIANNVLGGINFKNADRTAFYNEYIQIMQRSESEYDSRYDAWWNEMYKGGSN